MSRNIALSGGAHGGPVTRTGEHAVPPAPRQQRVVARLLRSWLCSGGPRGYVVAEFLSPAAPPDGSEARGSDTAGIRAGYTAAFGCSKERVSIGPARRTSHPWGRPLVGHDAPARSECTPLAGDPRPGDAPGRVTLRI